MNRMRGRFLLGAITALMMLAVPAQAGTSETCLGFDCDNVPDSICDPAGFKVSLTDYIAADDPANTTGLAIYTYQMCSPAPGTCTGDPSISCLDIETCQMYGAGTCDRECATHVWRDLWHFDIDFPDLGGANQNWLAVFQARIEVSNSLHLTKQVQLPECGRQIEVPESTALSLLPGKRPPVGSHAMDRCQLLQGLPDSDEILWSQITGDVHVASDQGAAQ